ncbi:MAG: D-alanyl-D-alanine carboxypeptidase [Hungatella sp.]|nr:D-alanyl-D-alanine carboxypeptidase [Hungatella sp.]
MKRWISGWAAVILAGTVAIKSSCGGLGPIFAAEPVLVAGSSAAKAAASRQEAGEELTWDEAAAETAGVSLSGPDISAPSAILMEASTGGVVYEKNADEQRSPASITKIMTLILIFDALESGKIHMNDEVTTSAYAKSMGGSQVFLEEGEVQTVETLIKCIVIASGNDASVAMAEFIAGDEKTFVDMMNERAKGLGMTGTHFEDCCGLTESKTHVTTARDIALMSRELINHYPQIHNYSTVWMDTITHVTKQGTKEFGLSNTNKLLKMATNFHVTGLKTGSTSLAKYCLSATAEKDGVRMIAAVMAAPDYKARFSDAAALLNFGYANCRLYEDKSPLPLPQMTVTNGVADQVELRYQGSFSYLGLHGEDFEAMERSLVLPEALKAPVKEGQPAGMLEYRLHGEKLGELPIVTAKGVKEARFGDYMRKVLGVWGMGD